MKGRMDLKRKNKGQITLNEKLNSHDFLKYFNSACESRNFNFTMSPLLL